MYKVWLQSLTQASIIAYRAFGQTMSHHDRLEKSNKILLKMFDSGSLGWTGGSAQSGREAINVFNAMV